MLDAGLQMDKLVSQIQQRLTDPGQELHLPPRVAEDQIAESGLASELRFGEGTADAPTDSQSSPPERRVIVPGGGD
ncbi:MAG: hypothetical protein ACYCWW_17445 [Deltaproteobacteria bacterium]